MEPDFDLDSLFFNEHNILGTQTTGPKKADGFGQCTKFPAAPSVNLPLTQIFDPQTPDISSQTRRHSQQSDLRSCNGSQDRCDRSPLLTQSLALPAITPGGSDHGMLKLKSIRELPEKFRDIFKFPYFNIVQSKVFDEVLYGDKHLVLGAPTGCGKTAILELAIIRLIMIHNETATLPTSVKIVYMAPMKALCSERYEDWCRKFSVFGIKCQELTGDTVLDDYYDLQDVHIILTTPEKWDSMTRRWRDNHSLVRQVELFLIDEVHLLNDSFRGATMEAVISRMKTIQSARSCVSRLRFVAISATVPNHDDVAEWLQCQGRESLHYSFDESCRPVRLRKVVLGFPCSAQQSEFRFDLSLNYKLADVIETYSDHKPTLVFCATRKSVQQGASILVKEARFIMSREHKQRLATVANSLRDNKLRDVVMCGVGFHHAGMDAQDRKTIESLFSQCALPVLLATSTLAMGVNLPAHLVVIKSTMHYVMGVYQEYSESQLLQMIGRAGRPQFDTSATAVIMTRTATKEKYESMMNGTQLIESSLHENLVEHVNAEIVLSTIKDISVAVEWLKSTFLYTRIMKNPRHYGISIGLTPNQVEKKLQDMCMCAVNSLTEVGLVRMDDDGFLLQSTELGRLMAHYCIAFETMKHFQQLGTEETLESLLVALCDSQEFKEVQLRNNEKSLLNSLNKHKNKLTIRFPMKGKIKTNEMKVNCLIQTQLGCLQLQEFALLQDVTKIFRSAVRISRCLVEVLWHKDGYKSLLNAVILAKCVKAKLWENSRHVTRQLTGIGPTMSNALANAGVVTFQHVQERNPRDLEVIVNRHPPFGNQMKEAVNKLPVYDISLDQSSYEERTAELTVTVTLQNAVMLRNEKSRMPHSCVLLLGDTDNHVVFKTRITDAMLLRSGVWSKRIEVHNSGNGNNIFINLISESIVGLDKLITFAPFYTSVQGAAPRMPLYQQGSKLPPDDASTQEIAKPGGSQKRKLDFVSGSGKPLSVKRRECGHHCLDKEVCAHDCCKTGVIVRQQRYSHIEQLRDDMKRQICHLPHTPAFRRLQPHFGTAPQLPGDWPGMRNYPNFNTSHILTDEDEDDGLIEISDEDTDCDRQTINTYNSVNNSYRSYAKQTHGPTSYRQIQTGSSPIITDFNSSDDELPELCTPKSRELRNNTSVAYDSADVHIGPNSSMNTWHRVEESLTRNQAPTGGFKRPVTSCTTPAIQSKVVGKAFRNIRPGKTLQTGKHSPVSVDSPAKKAEASSDIMGIECRSLCGSLRYPRAVSLTGNNGGKCNEDEVNEAMFMLSEDSDFEEDMPAFKHITGSRISESAVRPDDIDRNSLIKSGINDTTAGKNDTDVQFVSKNDTDRSFVGKNDTERSSVIVREQLSSFGKIDTGYMISKNDTDSSSTNKNDTGCLKNDMRSLFGKIDTGITVDVKDTDRLSGKNDTGFSAKNDTLHVGMFSSQIYSSDDAEEEFDNIFGGLW